MPTATLTSKGQITLPISMREKLHLVPGSKLIFEEQTNGDYVVRKRTGDIRNLRGILKSKTDVILTVEEMDDAIGRAVVGRLDRCR